MKIFKKKSKKVKKKFVNIKIVCIFASETKTNNDMKTYIIFYGVPGTDRTVMRTIDAKNKKAAEKEARSAIRIENLPYKLYDIQPFED